MNCPYIIISFSALIRVIRGIRVLFFIFWNFGVILYHRAHAMCPYGFKIRLISSILFILIPTVFPLNKGEHADSPLHNHSSSFASIRVNSRANFFYYFHIYSPKKEQIFHLLPIIVIISLFCVTNCSLIC